MKIPPSSGTTNHPFPLWVKSVVWNIQSQNSDFAMTTALQYHIKSIFEKFNFFCYTEHSLPSQSAVPKICFYFTPYFFYIPFLKLTTPPFPPSLSITLKEKLYNIVVYIKQITNINSLNPSTACFFFFQRSTEKLKT